MIVTSFLIAILSILLIYLGLLLRKHFTYWRNLNIACDPPHWMAGNLQGATVSKSFLQIWQEYYVKYKHTGPFAGFYWFTKTAVFVLDPDLAKQILIKDFSKFTDRGMFCNEEDDPLSGTMFSLEGARWRNIRNKLSPTFTSAKMKVMFPLVIEVGQTLTDVFRQNVADKQVVEVLELVSRFTTDVIGSCAFGIQIDSLRKPDAEFRKMCSKALVEQRFGIAFRFSFPKLARRLHIKQTLADVEEFFLDLVRKTVECREQTQERRNDFMDMLIDLKNNKLMQDDAGEEFTFGQIAAQAFSFLLAGYETSSTTMGFVLYELAQHDQVQQRAREEVMEVLDRHKQEFTYECMKEMLYLEQVIQETLRLYTVLPILNRQALEDYVVPGHARYIIKKGMPILIPAGVIHRDERFYPQPDVFNPDNFAPEVVAERDSVLYLPFGDGPRNCVGMRFGKMQVLVGLALLLKNFKFSVCAQTQIPMEYDKKSYMIRAEKGIHLKAETL